jgi:hypothetical protein
VALMPVRSVSQPKALTDNASSFSVGIANVFKWIAAYSRQLMSSGDGDPKVPKKPFPWSRENVLKQTTGIRMAL